MIIFENHFQVFNNTYLHKSTTAVRRCCFPPHVRPESPFIKISIRLLRSSSDNEDPTFLATVDTAFAA